MKPKKRAFAIVASATLLSGCAGTDPSTPPQAVVTKPAPLAYRDGTYRADGPYPSPIGADGITVEMTLSGGNGTIADFSVKPGANSLSMNSEWIDRFSRDIRKIVGKKISDIDSLGGVSGSTLTYEGFRTAVDSIRVQASSK
jgi:hypothetical protein